MSPPKRLKIDPKTSSKQSKMFIDELDRINQTRGLAEVKSFIIFGNSLYPHDYQIKFAGYECIRASGDYKMAASLLNEMYTKFPNETYGEFVHILHDVKKLEPSANKQIFYCLHAQVQYDILRKFCQSLESSNEQISLFLEMIKAMVDNISASSKYQQLLASEIGHLFVLLSDAEEDWRNTSARKSVADPVLNYYRYQLATEVLPLLHRAPKGVVELVDKRKVTEMVMKSLQFYLCYAGFIPDKPIGMPVDEEGFVMLRFGGSDPDSEVTIPDIWRRLRRMLSMAADLLKWYGAPSSSHRGQQQPGNVGISYEGLSTSGYCMQVRTLLEHVATSTSARQSVMIHQIGAVVWVGLAELIINYLRLAKPYLWWGDSGQRCPDMVFLFCRGEATGKLVNYQRSCRRMKQVHQAFSIATKLYAAVPMKDWDKISEKVEPLIRSQSWAFDTMFFLDLALLRGPLVKSKTYLRDPRLRDVYPRIYRDLMQCSISQCNREKNKKTLKALLDILGSCGMAPDERFQDGFEELPEMVPGHTYLVTLTANNVLMIVVHLLHGWLVHTAAARSPLAPDAAAYLLVLLQVKRSNFKSQVTQNCFILVQEGTGRLSSMRFLEHIVFLEIIEEIITQIEAFERANSGHIDDNKQDFINTLRKAAIDRIESPGFSAVCSLENILIDFIKNCKINLMNCIG